MSKYAIVRNDVGDEDRSIFVFDVYAGNKCVVSFYTEAEAQGWIDCQN